MLSTTTKPSSQNYRVRYELQQTNGIVHMYSFFSTFLQLQPSFSSKFLGSAMNSQQISQGQICVSFSVILFCQKSYHWT